MQEGYGILIYQTTNIGDEIQSVAAMRYLPEKPDGYVFRDRTDKFKLPGQAKIENIKLIMNGWWTWKPKYFRPPACITPLLISMHMRPKMDIPKHMRDYLIKHGPVGCRDKTTLERLQKLGIPAYYSGCLTLTIQRNPDIPKQDFVLAVDVSARVLEALRKQTDRPVYSITPITNPIFSPTRRLEIAKVFLALYQQAHCVVTSRLHAALPCLALETPILLLKEKEPRFEGLGDLAHRSTESEFLRSPGIFNIDSPPENLKQYQSLREDLIRRCAEFTGINHSTSRINDGNRLVTLINTFEDDYEQLKRSLWRTDKADLLKNLLYRVFSGLKRRDIYW